MFLSGKRRRGGGNRTTFITIIIIFTVIYVFRLTSPHKEAVYPDIITYKGLRYVYTETVKASPIKFTRKSPASDEGYMILARKGTSTLEDIYIYEGFRRYRHYEVLKE